MSQSSETASSKEADPFMLGYEHEGWSSSYYTALVAPGVGVCAFQMQKQWVLQFFPWFDHEGSGQSKYVGFITQKARDLLPHALFEKWPFITTESDNPMMLKCVIVDAVNKIGELNADHQRSAADAATGKAVE